MSAAEGRIDKLVERLALAGVDVEIERADVAALRATASDLSELADALERGFVVVVNQPGYLPEQEPVRCATLAEARDALVEELNATATAHELDVAEIDFSAEVELAKVAPPGEVISLSGYVHCLYAADVREEVGS